LYVKGHSWEVRDDKKGFVQLFMQKLWKMFVKNDNKACLNVGYVV